MSLDDRTRDAINDVRRIIKILRSGPEEVDSRNYEVLRRSFEVLEPETAAVLDGYEKNSFGAMATAFLAERVLRQHVKLGPWGYQ